jgi:hypothetical protein
LKETDDEAHPMQRRTDRRDTEAAPGRAAARARAWILCADWIYSGTPFWLIVWRAHIIAKVRFEAVRHLNFIK